MKREVYPDRLRYSGPTDVSATYSTDDLPELALIPAGKVLTEPTVDVADEQRRLVELPEFLIGVRPVSNAEYARFVRETGYRVPGVHELPLVATAGGADRAQAFRQDCAPHAWVDGRPPEGRLAHPVTLVRYEDAAEYCVWLSGVTCRLVRLPTDEEWERAARGGHDGSRYPWGDRLDRGQANFLADPALRAEAGTTIPGAYPPNAYGLYDMVGNVWEWEHAADEDVRVLRGGSWLVADVRMLSCSHRHRVPPDTYSYAIGFRVACPV